MRINHRDVMTPANAVTLAGLLLTAYGSLRLNTWVGFICASLGRILDILDGPIARRTHTSRFGAVLDATVDKITVLCISLGLLAYGIAPRAIVLYILLQHGAVSAMNLIAAHRKIVITTTVAGKRNIFLQMTAMLLFVCAKQLPWWPALFAALLAYTCVAISIPYAIRSFLDYKHAHAS